MTVTKFVRNDTECDTRLRLSYRQHLGRMFQLKAEESPSSTQPKVLVGGGSGFIGGVLCQSLKEKGYSVTVISRYDITT